MFGSVSWDIGVKDLLIGVFDYIMLYKDFLLLGLIIPFAILVVDFFVLIIYIETRIRKEERYWGRPDPQSRIQAYYGAAKYRYRTRTNNHWKASYWT